MHSLLGLLSLLLVLLGGYITLVILRSVRAWSHRRHLQLSVLAAPLMSLGLGLVGLHHSAGMTCFLGAPPWDYSVGLALPVGMGLFTLGGLGFGVFRLFLLYRVVADTGRPPDPVLQAVADRLAGQLGVRPPPLRIYPYDRPIAFTFGLWRPTLLLSTWMLEQLDARELESVLAHELGHVARRDYLAIWLATLLRDAFFYLPTTRAAFDQLVRDKEPACDDLAVQATQRPLALASALAKVWHQSVGVSLPVTAQPLVDPGDSIEHRITRLLAPSPAQEKQSSSRRHTLALGAGTSTLIGLLVFEAANVVFILSPLGCHLASPLGRLA